MLSENIEVESKLKTNILTNKYIEFIIDFLRLIENPYFDDEKFLNILRSDIIDIENIDVIKISRDLYKKNYSRKDFKLKLWDFIKDIESKNEENINFKNINKIIDLKDFILELNSVL
jgi:hypothetical protein